MTNGDCDFKITGLFEAQKMIEKVVWPVGSNGSEIAYNEIKTDKFYELERSNHTGKICTGGDRCNDTVTRTTKWLGQVALISPSDYGYATMGGQGINRTRCLNTLMASWGNLNDCIENNWLYRKNVSQWTLFPFATSNAAYATLPIDSSGAVNDANVYHCPDVYPCLFVKDNVKIVSGNGTKENSYQLVMD